MVVLTEEMVMKAARAASLSDVVNFNCWGMDLDDLSIFHEMPQVEVLSLSTNNISSLRFFAGCENLRELYLRRNQVEDMSQVAYLTGLKQLRVLWLSHNPIAKHPKYRATVLRALPDLIKLDDRDVTIEERDAAAKEGDVLMLPSDFVAPDDDDAENAEEKADEENSDSPVLNAVSLLLPLLSIEDLESVITQATDLIGSL